MERREFLKAGIITLTIGPYLDRGEETFNYTPITPNVTRGPASLLAFECSDHYPEYGRKARE